MRFKALSVVGKTNIFGRWLTGKFFEDTTATINIEFAAKAFKVDSKIVKVQIWDTAGQERFRALTRQYYRGAHGVALVYDITNKESFSHLAKWLADLRECCDNTDISILLIGNKSDLEKQRQVATLDALTFSKSERLSLIETSAKSGDNCTKAMQLILQGLFTCEMCCIYKLIDIHAVEQAKQQKLLAGGGTSQIPGASVVVGNQNPQQHTELCSQGPNSSC